MIERNISKYKLEKMTGIFHSALQYIFNEVNADVRFSTIAKVCEALDITLQDLFTDPIFNFENLEF